MAVSSRETRSSVSASAVVCTLGAEGAAEAPALASASVEAVSAVPSVFESAGSSPAGAVDSSACPADDDETCCTAASCTATGAGPMATATNKASMHTSTFLLCLNTYGLPFSRHSVHCIEFETTFKMPLPNAGRALPHIHVECPRNLVPYVAETTISANCREILVFEFCAYAPACTCRKVLRLRASRSAQDDIKGGAIPARDDAKGAFALGGHVAGRLRSAQDGMRASAKRSGPAFSGGPAMVLSLAPMLFSRPDAPGRQCSARTKASAQDRSSCS